MRKRYTSAFKAKIILEVLKEDKTIGQIASEHSVHPTQIRNWKTQALDSLPHLCEGDEPVTRAREAAHERELNEACAVARWTTLQVAHLSTASTTTAAAPPTHPT